MAKKQMTTTQTQQQNADAIVDQFRRELNRQRPSRSGYRSVRCGNSRLQIVQSPTGACYVQWSANGSPYGAIRIASIEKFRLLKEDLVMLEKALLIANALSTSGGPAVVEQHNSDILPL